MATNSSIAGYLAPTGAEPLYGDDLDDVFSGVIEGITGIVGELIRPRWQVEPPNQPDFAIDWVAFGIVSTKGDVFHYTDHDPTNDVDVQEYDEVLTILHSFYGPNSSALINRYNAGIQVEQNRDALTLVGIKLVECQEVTTLPALLKEKWVKRYDCRTIFRRRVVRRYPVLTAVANTNPTSGGMTVNNELYLTHINPSTP